MSNEASVAQKNNLIMLGVNHTTGDNYSDVFEVLEVIEEPDVVMLVRDIRTGVRFKITVEEINDGN